MGKEANLREVARRLLQLLRQVEETRAYGDERLLHEMKTLNLRLTPVYARLYGATPLITTSYPPHVWLRRAKEAASDALALLDADPSLGRVVQPPPNLPEPAPNQAPRRTAVAFLLMPFDEVFDWLRDVVVMAGKDVGVEVTRADDIFAAGSFLEQIKESIRDADAVVAVCTGRNPNVFYELGLSEPLHQPILLAEDVKDLPSDIAHLRAQLYGSPRPPNDRETLRARISQALEETLAARGVESVEKNSGIPGVALLNARIQETGGGYMLEIENEGTVPLTQVDWEIVGNAPNWSAPAEDTLLHDVQLEPGTSVHIPLRVSDEGPAAVELILRGKLRSGKRYERRRTVSTWG